MLSHTEFYPPESLVTKQQSVVAEAPACIEAPPPTSDEKPCVVQQPPTIKDKLEDPPRARTAVLDRESIHERALKIIEDSKPVSVEEKNRSNKSARLEKLERVPSKGHKGKPSKSEKSDVAVSVSTASTTVNKKIEVLSSEPNVCRLKPVPPVQRSKNQTGEAAKQEKPSRGKASKDADLRETPKTGTSDSKRSEKAESSASAKQSESSAWTKSAWRPQSSQDPTRVSPSPGSGHVAAKTNQIRTPSQPSVQTQSSVVPKSHQPESSWTSSQDSMSDWGDEMDPEELQVISRCRTDDDKISECGETGFRLLSCNCVYMCILL